MVEFELNSNHERIIKCGKFIYSTPHPISQIKSDVTRLPNFYTEILPIALENSFQSVLKAKFNQTQKENSYILDANNNTASDTYWYREGQLDFFGSFYHKLIAHPNGDLDIIVGFTDEEKI